MKILITIIIATLTIALQAQQAPSPDEQILLKMANQHRKLNNLPPLAWDPALARAANFHAKRIAQEPGPAQHQYPGEPNILTRASQAGAHFSTVAENVAGDGTTAAEIDQAWMASPVHRANILDPHLNAVGIAVVENHGELYAVEDFARSVPTLTPAEVEQQVSQLLRERGIKPDTSSASHQDASESCESDASVSRVPATIIQWDGPDLTQIPDSILQQVPRADIHAVAVASCPSKRTAEGFSTYRLALLIF